MVGLLALAHERGCEADLAQALDQDLAAGRLQLDITDSELAARLAALPAPPDHSKNGGYQRLYVDHVLQADEGCDFDFLVGCRGSAVPRHSH